MVEVGIRELKSRLSYYVQLMQTGETIAIKVRDHIVGFLTSQRKSERPSLERKWPRKRLLQRIEDLKREGIISSGGLFRMRRMKRPRLKGGLDSTQLIREMRDED